MKKNLLVTMLVGAVLTVVAATGCGASAPDAETGVNTETGTNTEESETVVKPLYSLETAQDALRRYEYVQYFRKQHPEW